MRTLKKFLLSLGIGALTATVSAFSYNMYLGMRSSVTANVLYKEADINNDGNVDHIFIHDVGHSSIQGLEDLFNRDRFDLKVSLGLGKMGEMGYFSQPKRIESFSEKPIELEIDDQNGDSLPDIVLRFAKNGQEKVFEQSNRISNYIVPLTGGEYNPPTTRTGRVALPALPD